MASPNDTARLPGSGSRSAGGRRPLRILVATDQWFPDFAGGAARVAAETARRLAERGHAVRVLAPRSDEGPAEEADGMFTLERAIPRRAVPQTLSDPVWTARCAERLEPASFDLLLAHQVTTAVGLRAAFPDHPLALVYHASALRELRFLRAQLAWGRRRIGTYALAPALALLERRGLGAATAVLVLSEFSRSLVTADHPGVAPRVVGVRAGTDVESFSPGDGAAAARRRLGIPRRTTLLLTVRRLEPRMGLEQLLEAFRSLTGPPERLLAVAGTGSLERLLHETARRFGLDERVRFLGRIDESALRDWYRAADLFVLPTVAYEGFGLATAEALASGTPVVGTPVGATPELLRRLDPGLVAAAANADALRAAIERSLRRTCPAFRMRCREHACAHLSWGTAISDWESALAALAPRPDLGTSGPGPSSGVAPAAAA